MDLTGGAADIFQVKGLVQFRGKYMSFVSCFEHKFFLFVYKHTRSSTQNTADSLKIDMFVQLLTLYCLLLNSLLHDIGTCLTSFVHVSIHLEASLHVSSEPHSFTRTQICLVNSTFQNKGKGVLQNQFASHRLLAIKR